MSFDRSTEVWRGRATSSVQMIGAQLYRAAINGPLRPGWMASVGVELSSRNLSIDRANARRVDKGLWHAEIDVVRLPNAIDPSSLSFVQLAESGRTPDLSLPIVLDRYTLTPSTLHGGSLELTFEAQDCLGLLGRMLADLAMLVLFPAELSIETHGSRVRDRLWLAGIHGPPSHEAAVRLEQRLARYRASHDR